MRSVKSKIPFSDYLFAGFDSIPYIKENGLDRVFEVCADIAREKIDKGIYSSVDPDNHVAFPVELDDIARLHYLITSRKVTTVLEFGVGKSTKAIAHALKINKERYASFVSENLRRSNPFELHSVDSMKEWIEECKKTIPSDLVEHVNIHHSSLNISTYNDKLCTYYNNIPNICPDLIYLDAPDQFSAQGSVRGLTTAHPDRMPMVADILTFEHFLLPGTLIVVDGRTANARFLKCNLQRNWRYIYMEDFDQHFFELHETPLGRINKKQIEFCLSSDFLDF